MLKLKFLLYEKYGQASERKETDWQKVFENGISDKRYCLKSI